MRVKIIFVFLNVFIMSSTVLSQYDKLFLACNQWNMLDEKIKTGTIEKEEALDLLKKYEVEILKAVKDTKFPMVSRNDWEFPLKKFTKITYRDGGNDYKLKDYDYFQGSNSKGHPAHDIFILDDNKDLLDDSTLKPVDVVSMSSGYIVAIDTSWRPGSRLRGGLYVKVYDIINRGIFYYSHLSKVTVRPGDMMNAGDKIGEVGRTGRKAILKDGKTHLHISFLKSVNGYPTPEDIIEDLRKSELKVNK
ncbi:MAG: hypothetical protein HGGPFJEG_02925 [Ignavibacteria bacterium]|nr:hypothetical protein [Ignavibacteria bacterium]